jgi:hypothetical protein
MAVCHGLYILKLPLAPSGLDISLGLGLVGKCGVSCSSFAMICAWGMSHSAVSNDAAWYTCEAFAESALSEACTNSVLVAFAMPRSQATISTRIVFFSVSLLYKTSNTSLSAHLYIDSMCDVIGDTLRFVLRRVQSAKFSARFRRSFV